MISAKTFVSRALYIAVFCLLTFVYAKALRADCIDCRMSETGVQMIRIFEGFSPVKYRDGGGYWTIGYGHLIRPGETFREPFMGPEAEKLLLADIAPTEQAINRLVLISLRQSQFDALGSFTFNLGAGRLASSSLLRYVNAGQHPAAGEQFMRWIYIAGAPSRGLQVRRKAESIVYLKD